MSILPSRRGFLQTGAAALASVIFPKSLRATANNRSYWFIQSDTGASWPVDDPVRWSLENALEPILERARERLLKLTPEDGERIMRLVVRRCKLNLIELLPRQVVVHHYWLDPVKQQAWNVGRHELWVLNQRNAQAAGIPQPVYDHLLTLNQAEDQDEIRLAAIQAGLVRIRDHGNHISVQFAAEPNRLRDVLRSVHKFLDEKTNDKFADLVIDNFTTRASVRLSLADLWKRLAEETPIFLREDLKATPS